MLVRNDEARKVQIFNNLFLLFSDQVKESISGIMIQSTFRMYKMTWILMLMTRSKKVRLFQS